MIIINTCISPILIELPLQPVIQILKNEEL